MKSIYVALIARRQWHPIPVLLPGKSHGRRILIDPQSMGSQRVGRDWVTSLSLFILPYRIPVLISFSQPCLHLHQGLYLGFPSGSVGKESPCNAGDPGLIPGLVRSPGKGNGNPLQYSCLENSRDKAGQLMRLQELDTAMRLTFTFTLHPVELLKMTKE